MQEERSVNILQAVLSMDIWLARWVQNILQNFCQRSTFSAVCGKERALYKLK